MKKLLLGFLLLTSMAALAHNNDDVIDVELKDKDTARINVNCDSLHKPEFEINNNIISAKCRPIYCVIQAANLSLRGHDKWPRRALTVGGVHQSCPIDQASAVREARSLVGVKCAKYYTDRQYGAHKSSPCRK